MSTFVGIDPSLTGSAVVVYDAENEKHYAYTLSSKADDGTMESRLRRVLDLSSRVVEAACRHGQPVLVGIEGPAYSSNTGKVWDRAANWWLIVAELNSRGIQVIEVPPTSRCKYATGLGNSKKDTVLLAVAKNYPHVEIKNNDEADALIICAMVARLKDKPFDSDLPKNKLDAMTKLKKDSKWDK